MKNSKPSLDMCIYSGIGKFISLKCLRDNLDKRNPFEKCVHDVMGFLDITEIFMCYKGVGTAFPNCHSLSNYIVNALVPSWVLYRGDRPVLLIIHRCTKYSTWHHSPVPMRSSQDRSYETAIMMHEHISASWPCCIWSFQERLSTHWEKDRNIESCMMAASEAWSTAAKMKNIRSGWDASHLLCTTWESFFKSDKVGTRNFTFVENGVHGYRRTHIERQ